MFGSARLAMAEDYLAMGLVPKSRRSEHKNRKSHVAKNSMVISPTSKPDEAPPVPSKEQKKYPRRQKTVSAEYKPMVKKTPLKDSPPTPPVKEPQIEKSVAPPLLYTTQDFEFAPILSHDPFPYPWTHVQSK
ncbi:protein TE24 [Testudinid alphaherpesvirus 3]|uniref:Protein TE24 n=1 Tax=Testudinid alphaherpesvirus 3 TaxID=2560801 RepID=A0A0M3MZ78_9ALPH|nr:protein TE24 [Testudinid alphaherpesvirus 3]AIU39340.1 protein TE24 [Testudinid alphaherpesvirus 3]AIU39435.1 protein TE24 [Testudinid alphaherpesvirus 3]AKI81710.1 protein TE24 [Testudinid alphaherpesvirus 3]AKI81725.1 protein TE24 [Testudinid alphaherpesvirus 3]AKI81811.1 protein TE24 [Testudinid alphaherpesvirus 3]